MKLLLDSNIIIDLWRNENSVYADLFHMYSIYICGVVRSELMHGAYSEKNLKEIDEKLNLLNEININQNQWSKFGTFLYRLRANGLTLPYADALIAFIAIENDIQLLTNDKHFNLISEIEPKLKLYHL